jgi:propanediol dehydratase small subunit
VIDPTDMERAALQSALKPLGECVALLGLRRPPADWSREEVLRLIEVVVDAYQAQMIEEHERMAARDRAFFEQLAARKASRPADAGRPF